MVSSNAKVIFAYYPDLVRKIKSLIGKTEFEEIIDELKNIEVLILDDFGIRKLTPEECVGFQGFPDVFSFPDDISNASKYKQAGNSVSVPVIKRIAENMIEAMK